MKVFYYDSLASTSTEAFRLLREEKIRTPFAVTAKTQTAGRGQRDRKWEGACGNIFLSLACTVSREQVRLLPLHVACVLVRFFQTNLTQRPCIKWPNDLLLDGKKFAGILCESFWEAHQETCTLVIGIGINVDHAPQIQDYETTCLKDFLIEKETAETLMSKFLKFWEMSEFQKTEDRIKDYEDFHLPKGSLWKDQETGLFFTNEGISPEGHLIVRNVKTGDISELVSAQHSLRFQKSHGGAFPV